MNDVDQTEVRRERLADMINRGNLPPQMVAEIDEMFPPGFAPTDELIDILARAPDIGQWVAERTTDVLLAKPWSRESARAFADMLREFEQTAPWLDPAFLPWIMFMLEHSGRAPTQDEFAEVVGEFERLD